MAERRSNYSHVADLTNRIKNGAQERRHLGRLTPKPCQRSDRRVPSRHHRLHSASAVNSAFRNRKGDTSADDDVIVF
ncbi:hypothetical protein ACWCYL_42610 [Streptomyces sp. 900105755]